jgi:hypothetical protein
LLIFKRNKVKENSKRSYKHSSKRILPNHLIKKKSKRNLLGGGHLKIIDEIHILRFFN